MLIVAGIAAGQVSASSKLQLGLFDDSEVLGRPDQTFPLLKQLHDQVIRVTLHWGGPIGVAGDRRPKDATDPDDPAYDWFAYDRAVMDADAAGIKVLFDIVDTPHWANGDRGINRAPTKMADLRDFAYAAAKRYSGTFVPSDGTTPPANTTTSAGDALPAVHLWLAWNEPNNPVFLQPQYLMVNKKWVAQSPITYAQICTAVFTGVHLTTLAGEKVACGATDPRGNNQPNTSRASIGPIPFLRALKKAGLKRFDAYAHHPYYSSPSQTPASKPKVTNAKLAPAVLLGNIGDLIKVVKQLYGNKRIWITEYGYQTNPPDKAFGVSYAKQALYLKQAVAIARKNPNIDLFIWYLLRDEKSIGAWQSGLMTANLVKKPSFAAFQASVR
jgi:hypothetical protein